MYLITHEEIFDIGIVLGAVKAGVQCLETAIICQAGLKERCCHTPSLV